MAGPNGKTMTEKPDFKGLRVFPVEPDQIETPAAQPEVISHWNDLPPIVQFLLAIHEAGHAVASIIVGLPFKRIFIRKNESLRGVQNLGGIVSMINLDDLRRTHAYRRALVFSSARAAVKRALPFHECEELAEFKNVSELGTETDRTRIIEIARKHFGVDDRQMHAFLARIEEQADKLFVRQAVRDAVNAVAAKLIENGEVTEKVVLEECAQVEGFFREATYPVRWPKIIYKF